MIAMKEEAWKLQFRTTSPNYPAVGPRPKQAPDLLTEEGRQPLRRGLVALD